MEEWTGVPLKLENLRIFDCAAYAHVKQGNIEDMAVKCIFLGYAEGVKG